jgi:hypothetical protein
MQPPEQLVSLTVLFRIYEAGGACPDTLDALTRRTGYNKRVVSDALNRLFGAGRLRRDPDGIRNPVADQVLEATKSLRKTRSVAGKEGAKVTNGKRPTNSAEGENFADVLPSAKSGYLHLQLHKQREEDSPLPPFGGIARSPLESPQGRLGRDVWWIPAPSSQQKKEREE